MNSKISKNTSKVQAKKQEAGQAAEESACQLLLSKGHQIIARNVRYKFGEIDIIAKDGPVLCFVEVRSRENSRLTDPKASIRRNKQEKIIRSASLYLQKNYKSLPLCRFDVISIVGYGCMQKQELIKNAFQISIQPRKRSGNPWQAY